jgi:ABC-type transport system involved in multi-copper enzyme maturation permease subunit
VRLPLAQRELARLVRSRRVYAWRGFLIGAFSLMLLIEWIAFSSYQFTVFVTNPEGMGRALYLWCVVAELVILFVIIPALAGPAIVAERRAQMLPLLMLADFRGWDIFAAKALTIMVEAGFLLVALAPLAFMTTIFGGVAPDAVWAQTAVVGATLVFAIALSLVCSCVFRNPTAAVIAAMFALAGSLIALVILDGLLVHRGSRVTLGFIEVLPLFLQPDAAVPSYRRSVVVLLALSCAAVAAVVLLLPRIVVDPPRRHWVGAPTPYGHTPRRLLRWGPVQPILSLYAGGLTSTLRTPGVRVLVAGLFVCIGLVPVVGILILVMLLAYEIITPLSAATRGGAIDDLRITPIPPRQLAQDTLLFFWRKVLLYVPGCIVSGMWLIEFVSDLLRQHEPQDVMHHHLYGAGLAATMVVLFVGFGLAQVFAMLGIGCVLGISGRAGRRQIVLAMGMFCLAYALCLSIAYLLDYWRFLAYIPAGFGILPAYLAGCTLIFAVLGWASRREFLRIVEGGRSRLSRALTQSGA